MAKENAPAPVRRSANLRWASADYEKHMPHYTVAWEIAVRETNEYHFGEKVARYKNTLTHARIQLLEAQCIDFGERLGLRREIYWGECDDIIGASLGEETRFIRVEVSGGSYHGYPITKKELDDEIKRVTKVPSR